MEDPHRTLRCTVLCVACELAGFLTSRRVGFAVAQVVRRARFELYVACTFCRFGTCLTVLAQALNDCCTISGYGTHDVSCFPSAKCRPPEKGLLRNWLGEYRVV